MELLTVATASLAFLYAHLGYAYVPLWGNLLLVVWFGCFGGNVGSFMNVVIYRLPAGVSVVRPGSRCPKCLHHIRWYDNIPVLSWLILRARCRDCGMPIASRYPTIEAIVSIWFVVVAFAGPIYMSEHWGRHMAGPLLRVPSPSWVYWLMYVNQSLAICTLICDVLMRYDGHVPPRKLFVPAFVVGCVMPIIWLGVHLVPFHAPTSAPDWLRGILENLAGLSVGISLALMARWSARVVGREAEDSLVAPFALVGLVLGWQAICVIAWMAVAAHLVHCWLGRWSPRLARLPASVHVVTLSTLYIICFVHIVGRAPFLGPAASIALFAASAALVVLCAALLAYLKPSLSRRPVGQAVDEDVSEPSALPSGGHRQASSEIPAGDVRFGSPEDPGEYSATGRPAHPPTEHSQGVANVTDVPQLNLQRILDSPSYRPAELDRDFLQRYELRPVRLQLELLKPEMGLAEQDVHSTIVAFGGTQVVEHAEAQARLERVQEDLTTNPGDPMLQRAVQRAERILAKAKYYESAREFARIVSSTCQLEGRCEYVIVTGGGPGIMEAANRGAFDVGAKSIGLNITLPEEQIPNAFVTPELCFQFHYFALRKMHFLLRAKALVVFPGGFGTLDELFDALTLRQTKRMQDIPIILFGRDYWERVIDFQFLADEGVIADSHLDLIDFVETPQQAWDVISRFYTSSQDAN